MSNQTFIIDIQILQTPAQRRGMGQYLTALLKQLHSAKPKDMRIILLHSNKVDKNSEAVRGLLAELPKFEDVSLPLVGTRVDQEGNGPTTHNRQILDDWVKRERLEGAAFLIGSLFQVELAPAFPAETQKYAIVYDVIPVQLFREYKSRMKWEDYLKRFALLYQADGLLAISQTTANDLQTYCSIDAQKIYVVYGGPSELNKVKMPERRPKGQYILMPTGNDLRKNNRRAVLGFEHYRLRTGSNMQLVITSTFNHDERQELNKLSPNLVFTGAVSNEEIAWYYEHCSLLLFPSLYEGLGMPLIEAMQFKKPIAASDIEVFTELSLDLPYYFDPAQPVAIAKAIYDALNDGGFQVRRKAYEAVTKNFTWHRTVQAMLKIVEGGAPSDQVKRKPRLAVVGPYPNGVSAIGKYIFSLHSELSKKFEVDYYFESSPIDVELRPNILQFIAKTYDVRELTDKRIKSYDSVVYNIGNSNHHTITAARALVKPGIVVIHDLKSKNVYDDLLKRRMIDEGRYSIEERLNEGHPVKFVYSILSRQRGVITHSNYAANVLRRLLVGNNVSVKVAQLCVDTPRFIPMHEPRIFTIGLAGILANIKGLQIIEKLAQDERFHDDKILIFGLDFAERGVLDRLRELPNVELAVNLTDYEFQQNLKRMSVFVNFRTEYQGEASYSTLETMRYGIPVIVRGDFGWYSELPDGSVIKLTSEDRIGDAINKLKLDNKVRRSVGSSARQATAERYNQQQYAETVYDLFKAVSKR